MLGKVLALMSTTVATPVAAQCGGEDEPPCRYLMARTLPTLDFGLGSDGRVGAGEAEDTVRERKKTLLIMSIN